MNRLFIGAIVFVVFITPQLTQSAPLYTIELIEHTVQRVGNDVNESSQVLLGKGGGTPRTEIWDSGVATQIDNPDWITESGLAMNNDGVVVGYAWMNTTVGTQAFHYNPDSQAFTAVPFGGTRSEAADINNQDQVVGFGQDTNGNRRAKLWENNAVVDLGLLPGMIESNAYDINELGQVVGKSWPGNFQRPRPFIWENGVMTEIPASGYGSAHEINDHGDIIGIVNSQPVVWIDGTEHTLVGTLNYSTTFDINNNGQIVGYTEASNSAWYYRKAVLWENLLPYDLNDLVVNKDPSYILHEAISINEQGQIVGYGKMDGIVKGAFILTPVPEPSAILLFGCVSAIMLIGNRHRV